MATSSSTRSPAPTITLDYDLVFLQAVRAWMLEFNGVELASLAQFTAGTGQEANGLQADPKFKNVRGEQLHPRQGITGHRLGELRGGRPSAGRQGRQAAEGHLERPRHRRRPSYLRRPRRLRGAQVARQAGPAGTVTVERYPSVIARRATTRRIGRLSPARTFACRQETGVASAHTEQAIPLEDYAEQWLASRWAAVGPLRPA